MNIRNKTNIDIEFDNLGFTLEANSIRNLAEIDPYDVLLSNIDELVMPMLEGKVEFYENDTIYSEISSIAAFLSSGITKVDIREDNILNVQITNQDSLPTTKENTYYYFKKNINIIPGQKFSYEFKGHIRELDIELSSGNIVVNINEMGDIELKDYTHFDFDIDYKLKDPIVEITCNKISSFTLFIEGSYENPDKSKKQYLKELNSTEAELDVPVIKDTQKLTFNCNFSSVDYTQDKIFLETTSNIVGNIDNITETFNTDKIFKDGMYVDFGDIANINQEKEYTLSLWFNIRYLNWDEQKIITNLGNYSLYMKNTKLYFRAKNTITLTQEEQLIENKWYNIQMIYKDNRWTIYLDGEYVGSVEISKYKASPLIIGNERKSMEGLQLQKFKIYNYSFSNSMVNYLINTQNPETEEEININYEQGVCINFFDCNGVENTPKDGYEFLLIEKKYANRKSFISSQDIPYIDSINTLLPNNDRFLSIIEGYIYLPESGDYIFGIDGDDAVEFSIDEEVIVSWYNNHGKCGNLTSHTNTNDSKFLSAGYHKFKFRHFENYGVANFGLGWIKPTDAVMELIPQDSFFRRKINPNANMGLFGMYNCIPYGCVYDKEFDNIKASLVHTENYDFYKLQDLKTLRFSNMNGFDHQQVFTFNYWIYTDSGYNYIFSIGNKNYIDYLSNYSSRDRIYQKFENINKTQSDNININDWTMISITGNGNTLTFYKDGEDIGSVKQKRSIYYEYNPKFVNWGTVSSGTPPSYMRSSKFKLSEWFFDDKCYTKSELFSLYSKTKEKYNVI